LSTANRFLFDRLNNTVKQFDAATGAYEGTFVTSGSGGLLGPRGLIFGESHNLLVVNQNVLATALYISLAKMLRRRL
jgi:hypothetical protein